MPIDLLNGFPGKSTKYELKYNQEFSRTASGQVLVQDMATPYWVASWNLYQPMHPYEFEIWRARFNRMKGSLETFYAYAPSYTPLNYIQHPSQMPDLSNITISSINTARNYFRSEMLPTDFRFTAGDYVLLGENSLHSVYQAWSRAAEVYPPIPQNIAVGAKVTIIRPYCLMRIVPDSLDMSIDDTGRGSISFDAEQVL